MHHFPFHVSDYKAATAHLSDMEDLAYRRLLDMYYDTEKPIALDIAWVSRRIRIKANVVEGVLKDFFTKKTDGFHNSRCDEEIVKYQSFKDSGARGAAVRWGKGGDRDPIGTLSNPNSNQEPRTSNQEPLTKNQEPENREPSNSKAKTLKPSDAPKTGAPAPAKTSATWESYCQAYEKRYQAAPIRNAKLNGMLARFIERVPTEEAPGIAAFYVEHNGQSYMRRMHCIDMMLSDAEKLRTEWITGNRMTVSEARQAEHADSVRQQAKRVEKLLGEMHEAE